MKLRLEAKFQAGSLHGDLTVQNIREETRRLKDAFDLMVAIHSLDEAETLTSIDRIEVLLKQIYPPMRSWVRQRDSALQYILKFKEDRDWTDLQSAMDSLEELLEGYSTRL